MHIRGHVTGLTGTCSRDMSAGKDYDLLTHTEMYLERVPGKCCRDMSPRVKQQRNKDHKALVTSMWKEDGGTQ